MEKLLNIGIIQAIVDPNLAWSDSPQMDVYEANVIWRQIQAAFASFQGMSDTKKPDIVVIPELATELYSMYHEIGHMGSKLEKSKQPPSILGSILLHERK